MKQKYSVVCNSRNSFMDDVNAYIPFGSSTVPTTDNTGKYVLTSNNTPVMYNDATRGYVMTTAIATSPNLQLNIPISNKYSFSCWVYRTTAPAGGQNAISWDGTNSYFQVNTSTLQLYGGVQVYSSTGVWTQLATGSWKFITGVMDGTNATIYINAVSGTSVAYTATPTSTAWLLGGYNGVANGYNGYLGTFRYYNRALTSSEITTIYNSELLMYKNNLKYCLNWSFLPRANYKMTFTFQSNQTVTTATTVAVVLSDLDITNNNYTVGSKTSSITTGTIGYISSNTFKTLLSANYKGNSPVYCRNPTNNIFTVQLYTYDGSSLYALTSDYILILNFEET